MSEPVDNVVIGLLEAWIAGDEGACAARLAEGVTLRLWRWDGTEVHTPGPRVLRRLLGEQASWSRSSLAVQGTMCQGERVAVEYLVHALEGARAVEHSRSLFARVEHGRVSAMDIYCAEPVPCAYRDQWVDRKRLGDEELDRLLESARHDFESRRAVSSNVGLCIGRYMRTIDSEEAHPAANMIMNARLPAAEADARIAAIIAHHQRSGRGFSWMVSPWDRPADLGKRLEAHGMVLAGHAAIMVRRGFHDLDAIPVNPEVRVTVVDLDDEAAIDATLEIVAAGFKWPEGRKERLRSWWRDRARDPAFRAHETRYVAWVDGHAVAYCQLTFRAGLACLDGAATLPEYRNRRVYSTLLRRRLADAQARGYEIAIIDAQPMARRVVVRYGFEEYARLALYGWMPEIDMDVIRSLISAD
jgi:hypothetical protein